MPIFCYGREQSGLEALLDEDYQEASEGWGDEYSWVQGDWDDGELWEAGAHQKWWAAQADDGETAVLGQDGAAEDQLYSQRAECGLWGGIL